MVMACWAVSESLTGLTTTASEKSKLLVLSDNSDLQPEKEKLIKAEISKNEFK